MTDAVKHAETPKGWEGLLSAGESILWQGPASPKISFQNTDIMSTLMGLFFMGFSLFWIRMASEISGGSNMPGPTNLFPLFGLPFFLIGLYNAIGHVFWKAYLRQSTHYTLTNKRAFIAAAHPFKGKTLTAHDIGAGNDVTLTEGPPDSVWFAQKTVRNGKHSYTKPVGFEHISEGRKVFALIRDIQKDTP
jgi:hypothetical protein